jgi:hypothetical protein
MISLRPLVFLSRCILTSMLVATSSGSIFARSEFLSAHEGAYGCTLSSNVTATMGRPTKQAEAAPPATAAPNSAETARRRAESLETQQRLLAEATDKSKRPAPLARLTIARRDASWLLTLRFAQVPAESSLRDLAVKIADTSPTAPSVDLDSGKGSTDVVTIMATDATLSLYVNEPVASDFPKHLQVHLRSADQNIELIVWTIDAQGRRGHGRNCLMARQ